MQPYSNLRQRFSGKPRTSVYASSGASCSGVADSSGASGETVAPIGDPLKAIAAGGTGAACPSKKCPVSPDMPDQQGDLDEYHTPDLWMDTFSGKYYDPVAYKIRDYEVESYPVPTTCKSENTTCGKKPDYVSKLVPVDSQLTGTIYPRGTRAIYTGDDVPTKCAGSYVPLSEYSSSGMPCDVGVSVGPIDDTHVGINVGLPESWKLPSDPLKWHMLSKEDFYGYEGPTPYGNWFCNTTTQDNTVLTA